MSRGFHRLPPSTVWSNSAAPPDTTLAMLERAEEFIGQQMAEDGFPVTPKPIDPAHFEPGPSARDMGYTGDQCSNCSSIRMKMAGHCMVCEDCGTTTGCS
jgi:hypothetical protein